MYKRSRINAAFFVFKEYPIPPGRNYVSGLVKRIIKF